MNRTRTPALKKERDYQHHHVAHRGGAVNNHKSSRAGWPLVKARSHRTNRRLTREAVEQTLATPDREDQDTLRSMPFRRRRADKWGGAAPLGDWLSEMREQRAATAVSSLFRDCYVPARDREPFHTFFTTHLEGGHGMAPHMAAALVWILAAPLGSRYQFGPLLTSVGNSGIWSPPLSLLRLDRPSCHRQLIAFFNDEPQWVKRIVDILGLERSKHGCRLLMGLSPYLNFGD